MLCIEHVVVVVCVVDVVCDCSCVVVGDVLVCGVLNVLLSV